MALLPGMTANLQVVTEDRRDVLRVAQCRAALPPGRRRRPSRRPHGTPRAGRGGAAGGGAALRERIETELQPTPEQKQAIAAILQERRGGGREAMAGLSRRRTPCRLPHRAHRDAAAKIAAALDPDRRARFEAMMQEGGGARQQGAPGRIYVLDEGGQPRPVPVMLGPTDGAFTEIVGGEVKEGAQVVIGGGPRPATPPAPAGGPPVRGPRLF